MRSALEKHWDILLVDKILQNHVSTYPSVTYRRSENLRDTSVHSHHAGEKFEKAFGSKGCVACGNVETGNNFWNSQHTSEYKITHHITCSTSGVIYFATCPCGLIYIGMTTRQLRRSVREHVLGIIAAKKIQIC